MGALVAAAPSAPLRFALDPGGVIERRIAGGPVSPAVRGRRDLRVLHDAAAPPLRSLPSGVAGGARRWRLERGRQRGAAAAAAAGDARRSSVDAALRAFAGEADPGPRQVPGCLVRGLDGGARDAASRRATQAGG